MSLGYQHATSARLVMREVSCGLCTARVCSFAVCFAVASDMLAVWAVVGSCALWPQVCISSSTFCVNVTGRCGRLCDSGMCACLLCGLTVAVGRWPLPLTVQRKSATRSSVAVVSRRPLPLCPLVTAGVLSGVPARCCSRLRLILLRGQGVAVAWSSF